MYLDITKYLAIKYRNKFKGEAFLCASNAAFMDNIDQKSSDRFIIKLFGKPIN